MPSINNNFFANAYKIKLSYNSTDAPRNWNNDPKKWKKGLQANANNLAIPTGELNDCVVIHIDSLHLKDIALCKFLKKFYNGDINNHKGIVQKTHNDCYHLFFKYRSDLLSYEGIGKYRHIHIRSNDDYVVISPSQVYGKKYKVLKDEPLEQMTDEMFNYIQKLIQKENKRQERLDRLASQPLRRTSEQKKTLLNLLRNNPRRGPVQLMQH